MLGSVMVMGSGLDLVNKQRNYRTAGAHNVSVSRAADDRAVPFRGHAGVGKDHMLHHGLGDSHGVDGIGSLVNGKTDHAFHTCIDGRVENIVRPLHIGLDGLHREELAGWHLLERSGMEDIIHARHGVGH